MKRSQMMISFGAYDDDVYEFLQNEKNASAFIRRLVRAHMSGSLPPTQPINTVVQEQTPVIEAPKIKEEKIVEDIAPAKNTKVKSNNNKLTINDISL